MLAIIGYYVLFLLIGVMCGDLCPEQTVITGWNAVGHYYEEEQTTVYSELLAFIVFPILIVAIIILIVKTKADIKRGKKEYVEDEIESLKEQYKKFYENKVAYSEILGFCGGLNIVFIILSIFGIGLILEVLNILVALYAFVKMKLSSAKMKRIEEKLRLLNVNVDELIQEKAKKQEEKENKIDKETFEG